MDSRCSPGLHRRRRTDSLPSEPPVLSPALAAGPAVGPGRRPVEPGYRDLVSSGLPQRRRRAPVVPALPGRAAGRGRPTGSVPTDEIFGTPRRTPSLSHHAPSAGPAAGGVRLGGAVQHPLLEPIPVPAPTQAPVLPQPLSPGAAEKPSGQRGQNHGRDYRGAHRRPGLLYPPPPAGGPDSRVPAGPVGLRGPSGHHIHRPGGRPAHRPAG